MKSLILFLLFFPFAVFAEQSLILNTENEPPFSMRKNELTSYKPDDPLTGISVDILNILFSRVRVSYAMRIDSWDASYKNAVTNANHGVFSTTRTKEREDIFKWVGPLVVNDWVLVGRANFDAEIREIGDPNLRRLKIGTLKSGALDTYLRGLGIPTILFENGFEGALALKEGKIDLWAVGGPTALYYGEKVGANNLKNVFILKRHQFLYLALNRKVPDALVDILNKELGIMRRDGTIKAIYRKYKIF